MKIEKGRGYGKKASIVKEIECIVASNRLKQYKKKVIFCTMSITGLMREIGEKKINDWAKE